jgi:hypothetical protein
MKRTIILTLLISLAAACDRSREVQKGVVNLEIGIDYKIGGIQPVARQEFYLMDSDLTAGNELDEFALKSAKDKPALKLWALTALVEGVGPEDERLKVTRIIQAHTVAKGITDLQGKVTFSPVNPGIYYLLGWSSTRKDSELLIWNFGVEVKPGEQKVSLSSLDAATLAPHLPPLRLP